ncbi:hypothetical protein [Novosphingobium panipatense]|uniref:hypothetical protein n=1 Tax=Novosphingobium panipatense TaxID=428991 RepID=UPI00361378B6
MLFRRHRGAGRLVHDGARDPHGGHRDQRQQQADDQDIADDLRGASPRASSSSR